MIAPLQFGLDAVVEENPPPPCPTCRATTRFNSASTLSSRRTALGTAALAWAKSASIRPRRCRRGEPRDAERSAKHAAVLQFGLDAVVEENAASDTTIIASGAASIRPRRCRRGELRLRASQEPCRRAGFNSASTLSSRRTMDPGFPHGRVLDWLQFGLDAVVEENFCFPADEKGWQGASIRPRRCRRGEPPAATRRAPRPSRFNSASTLSSRRTPLSVVDAGRRERPLQFGLDAVVEENSTSVTLASS